MRLAQIADLARSNGWRSVLREMVFFHRTAIVVEKDLSEIANRFELLARARMEIVEIDRKMLSSGAYRFALHSRWLKALHNVERGHRGIALVRDNVVIGDTWYWVSESTDDHRRLHVDLRRFGFKGWSKGYVYTFDIFVAPAERKSGISAAFQNSAMLLLRSKGYTKAFGFYWADNIPAHWCTRVTNKWKKLRAVNASRFLIFTKSVPVLEEEATSKVAASVEKSLREEKKRESDHGRAADKSADDIQVCVRH
jgi:GNAT superfamily N-acetyltransferase